MTIVIKICSYGEFKKDFLRRKCDYLCYEVLDTPVSKEISIYATKLILSAYSKKYDEIIFYEETLARNVYPYTEDIEKKLRGIVKESIDKIKKDFKDTVLREGIIAPVLPYTSIAYRGG